MTLFEEKKGTFWEAAHTWLVERVKEIENNYKGRIMPLRGKKLFAEKKFKALDKIKKEFPENFIIGARIILAKGKEKESLARINEEESNKWKRLFIFRVKMIEKLYEKEFSHYCEKQRLLLDEKNLRELLDKATENGQLDEEELKSQLNIEIDKDQLEEKELNRLLGKKVSRVHLDEEKLKKMLEEEKIKEIMKIKFMEFLNKDVHNHHFTRMLGLTLQEIYNKFLPIIGPGEFNQKNCPVENLYSLNNYRLNKLTPFLLAATRAVEESKEKLKSKSDSQDVLHEDTTKIRP